MIVGMDAHHEVNDAMAETAPDATRIVEDYVKAWNEQDDDEIADVVSESFVHVSPAAPDGAARGPDRVEEFMREVTAGFPDFELTIEEMLSRDETVMTENHFTMTPDGEFDGIPPTNRQVEIRSMAKCRVVDGELDEIREYLNMPDVFDQLGVTADQPTD